MSTLFSLERVFAFGRIVRYFVTPIEVYLAATVADLAIPLTPTKLSQSQNFVSNRFLCERVGGFRRALGRIVSQTFAHNRTISIFSAGARTRYSLT